MSLLLQAQPLDQAVHPFLAEGRLDLLPEPLAIEEHAVLYRLGPVLDLLVEEETHDGTLRFQWQVRLPTLPADPGARPLVFPRPPGADVLPFGSLPDPGPRDAALDPRVRQALGLIFSPEARAKIHGLFALARLRAEAVGARGRLAARDDGGFTLSVGGPRIPGGGHRAQRLPLLEDATPEDARRLAAHVGDARGLLHGQVVDPVAGVDIAFRRGRSSHERLLDHEAAARLLEAAGIPSAHIPSRRRTETSI